MESSLSACTVRGQFTTIPKNLKSAVAPMVYTRIYKLFMMNRDSDATEIEDESLHLYFSSEESASLLSGSPQVCHVLFCFQMLTWINETRVVQQLRYDINPMLIAMFIIVTGIFLVLFGFVIDKSEDITNPIETI